MATISSTLSLIDNMSNTLTSIQSKVQGLVEDFESLDSQVTGAQNTIDNFNLDSFSEKCTSISQKMTEMGNTMTFSISGPLALLGKQAYSSATAHETAFKGMTKTVNDATEEQHQALSQMAYELSEIDPTGYVKLMGVMQTGGNLGVGVEYLEEFARVATALNAATDNYITLDSGIENVASFLNIVDGGVQNIEQFGSALVYLGNHFNSTEDKILSMAVRMASAGDFAGLSSAEILGMASAFSAVGINAEAGGSAASKLITQMERAATVGYEAQTMFGAEYGSAVDFSHYISNKSNLLDIAAQLDVTTDYVQRIADSWLMLEQFSEVSGQTAEQFANSWATNPGQNFMDFFVGLNAMDTSGMESAIAMLDKMGITEIRESNLVRAMSTNPTLFVDAVNGAVQAYETNVAMWDEYGTQISTQEAQNQMLANKWNNTLANYGNNVVEAVQPILDKANELLTVFNGLSEVDQDRIINLLGALVITGPTLIAAGKTVTAIGNIAKGIQKIANCQTVGAVLDKVTAFLATPAGTAFVLAAGVAAVARAISSIPDKAELVYEALKDIPITIDQEQYDAAMAQIDALQAKIIELRADPAQEMNLARTSTSVEMGFGTNTMYNDALVYQAAVFEEQYTNVANEYSAKIAEATQQIINAEDAATKGYWLGQVETLEAESEWATNQVMKSYSEHISALYNGMTSQLPEFANQMEAAAKQYDFAGHLATISHFDWDAFADQSQADAAWDGLMRDMYSMAFDLGYMEDAGYDTKAQMMAAYEAGLINNSLWTFDFQNIVMDDLKNAVQAVSDNPIANTWLQTILNNEALMENLDLTQLTGAMDGIVKALDFNNAMIAAGDAGNPRDYGSYLMEGLANGIDNNAAVAAASATAAGSATVEALGTSLGVNSPSVYAMEQGRYLDVGLAQGITSYIGLVTAAVASTGIHTIAAMRNVCNQVIAVSNSLLNHAAGFSIGYQVSAGMAAGIRSGQSSVISAARAVAQAAITAAKSTLGIHSPSTVFRGLAVNTGKGYVIGLNSMEDEVNETVGRLFSVDTRALDGGVWSNIGLFSDLETQQFGADDNDDLKVSDSDMKKIRELAEREVINQFTTAELHIDFTANNNIHSDLDLDGVVSYLEDKVTERLEEVAEGVYQ